MSAAPKPLHTVTDAPVDDAPAPVPLTTTERAAFVGMQARQREIVQAFNAEERAICAEIEARLGLDGGAIGSTHTIDPQTWTVAEVQITAM